MGRGFPLSILKGWGLGPPAILKIFFHDLIIFDDAFLRILIRFCKCINDGSPKPTPA